MRRVWSRDLADLAEATAVEHGYGMIDAASALPPELVAEAMDVMGRAFVAIRSATHRRYAMGEALSPERVAAIGTLADALHNVPAWVRADPEGRWVSDEATVRRELDVAVSAIDVLQGRKLVPA